MLVRTHEHPFHPALATAFVVRSIAFSFCLLSSPDDDRGAGRRGGQLAALIEKMWSQCLILLVTAMAARNRASLTHHK